MTRIIQHFEVLLVTKGITIRKSTNASTVIFTLEFFNVTRNTGKSAWLKKLERDRIVTIVSLRVRIWNGLNRIEKNASAENATQMVLIQHSTVKTNTKRT